VVAPGSDVNRGARKLAAGAATCCDGNPMAHGSKVNSCFPTGLPYPGIMPFLRTAPPAQLGLAEELDPDAPETRDKVRAALGSAQLLAEVDAMPEGAFTIVGERGVQLSGGQKQRVALGRALLAQPKVLVLDDPLSAVDTRTEAAILDAIDEASRGRTLVLVTHRVAAAARCDLVVVLDAGRVIEAGTHDELIARDGLYARLAERQALEAELEAM